MMLMFLVSLLAVIVVFSIGAGVAQVISMIPLSILERARNGGRYSRLGSPEPPPLHGRNALLLPGVHAE